MNSAANSIEPAATEVEADEPAACETCGDLGIVEVGNGPSAHEVACPDCGWTAEDEEHARADMMLAARKEGGW